MAEQNRGRGGFVATESSSTPRPTQLDRFRRATHRRSSSAGTMPVVRPRHFSDLLCHELLRLPSSPPAHLRHVVQKLAGALCGLLFLVGGHAVYKYRMRRYMDSEIRAIMAYCMPLDNQSEVHNHNHSHNHNHVDIEDVDVLWRRFPNSNPPFVHCLDSNIL